MDDFDDWLGADTSATGGGGEVPIDVNDSLGLDDFADIFGEEDAGVSSPEARPPAAGHLMANANKTPMQTLGKTRARRPQMVPRRANQRRT